MKRTVILLIAVAALAVMIAAIGLNKNERSTEDITGSATGEGHVSFRILSACSIPLQQGWNLVSICSNMTNKTVKNALVDIDGEYRYVMEWNESSQEFIIYSPLAAGNPFDELSENRSYFIYLLPLNRTMNTAGRLFDEMTLPLIFGWNAPIYPYDAEADITRYLGQINGSYRYAMIWNSSSQKFLIYSPLAAENDFQNISAGQGQFVYVSNESGATIKYNRSILG